MKVLDLDMDFFLTDACPLAPLGERPSETCAEPYRDEQIIRFLEEQCGLSRERPVPGAIFDTHDKALDFWLARMQKGELNAPFDVVHVDTHSDLAFGPPGTDFVLKAVLTRRPDARAALDAYRARNPKSHQDIPGQLLDSDGNIHLRSAISALMEAANGREPTIPFEVFDDYTQFHETGYDFVTMAQSPRYAPASADRIMRLLEPYLMRSDG